MNKIITIDGIKYKRIEEEVKPEYKIGDWVKVIANCTLIAEKNNYVGQTYQITNVYNIKAYPRGVMPYGIGKDFVVYEDELEPAEESKQDLFDINDGEKYYWIGCAGEIRTDIKDIGLDLCITVANACKDEKLMEQRALHEVLDRLLWRASIEAGELDNPWDGNNSHYYIYYESKTGSLGVEDSMHWSIQGVCYFSTYNAAQSAIENIVKPFMKKHPDFEW